MVGVLLTDDELRDRDYPFKDKYGKATLNKILADVNLDRERVRYEVNKDDNILYFYGLTIDNFILLCLALGLYCKNEFTIYFTNSSKFDGQFICDYLLDNPMGLQLVQDYDLVIKHNGIVSNDNPEGLDDMEDIY